MNSIEDLEKRHDESAFKGRFNEKINGMIECMFEQDEKSCKKCDDIFVCSLLMEAVFTFRNNKKNKPSA